MRQMPDIAAVEIERLRDDGIQLTDDDIVWLASLGDAVENPDGTTKEAAGLIDGLRMSDGTILKPLTMYAEKWLKKYGAIFSGRMELAAVGYAMSHAESLDVTESKKAVMAAVREWIEGIKVTPDELKSAVSRMIGDSDQPKQDPPKLDRESLIGFMVAATGLAREYWEHEPWVAVDRAHSGIMKYAAMIAGTEYDPDKHAGKQALKNLGLAIIEIRKGRE